MTIFIFKAIKINAPTVVFGIERFSVYTCLINKDLLHWDFISNCIFRTEFCLIKGSFHRQVYCTDISNQNLGLKSHHTHIAL